MERGKDFRKQQGRLERGKDFRKERATKGGDGDVEYHCKRDNDRESKIVKEGKRQGGND